MERTKAELKKDNILHGIVERFFPKSKKYPFGHKEDLFGILDLIALDNGVVGIQVCGTDLRTHKQKIMEEKKESTYRWLNDGQARFEVWAWRKLKKRKGGKAMVWKPRIIDILIVNNELYWEERI